jgi:lipid-A-disaccharide synthase
MNFHKTHHFFIVAGEPSGDAHAARLMRAIKRRLPNARFSGIGGEAMEREAGFRSIVPLSEISVVGFWEVAKRYGMFQRLLRKAAAMLASGEFAAFIPVDYPGFNMRLAAFAKRYRVPVLWYIAPQLWAWGENRAEGLKRVVDELMVVFPFEEEFFRSHGIKTHFVGHPLMENKTIAREVLPLQERVESGGIREIALLPGSREQELSANAGVMLAAAALLHTQIPNLRFTLAAAPQLGTGGYERIVEGAETLYGIKLGIETDSRDLLRRARAGIVKTGTSTLEAALCGMPHTMMYRTSWLSYRLAKRVVRLTHIALPNILAEKELHLPPIIRECIQQDAKPEVLAQELMRLLDDDEVQPMLESFAAIRSRLTQTTGRGELEHECASEAAARIIAGAIA